MYIRLDLRTRSARVHDAGTHESQLTFVDVVSDRDWNPETIVDSMRDLRVRILAGSGTVLFRNPDPVGVPLDNVRLAPLVELLAAHPSLSSDLSVGVLTFSVGRSPMIVWARNRGVDEFDAIELARQTELAALIDWGAAI